MPPPPRRRQQRWSCCVWLSCFVALEAILLGSTLVFLLVGPMPMPDSTEGVVVPCRISSAAPPPSSLSSSSSSLSPQYHHDGDDEDNNDNELRNFVPPPTIFQSTGELIATLDTRLESLLLLLLAGESSLRTTQDEDGGDDPALSSLLDDLHAILLAVQPGSTDFPVLRGDGVAMAMAAAADLPPPAVGGEVAASSSSIPHDHHSSPSNHGMDHRPPITSTDPTTTTHDEEQPLHPILHSILHARTPLVLRVRQQLETRQAALLTRIHEAEQDLDPWSSWWRLYFPSWAAEAARLRGWRERYTRYDSVLDGLRGLEGEGEL